MAKIRISTVPGDPKPFIADYMAPETLKRTQVPCTTLEQAQKELAKDVSWKFRKPRGQGMTISMMVHNFLKRLTPPTYSKGYCLQITRNLESFVVPVLGTMLANEVRPIHVQQLFLHLRRPLKPEEDQGAKPAKLHHNGKEDAAGPPTVQYGMGKDVSTARGIMRQLKTCYRDAIAAGYLKTEPVTDGMKEVEGYASTRKATDLPPGTYDKILAVADARDRLICLLLGVSGLIPNEVPALRRRNFHLDRTHPKLSVVEIVEGNQLRDPNRKAVQRTINLAPEVVEALLAYERSLDALLLPDDLLFVASAGTPLSDRAIGHVARKLANAAGVSCTAKELRFHAAARCVAEGMSIVSLAAHLGLDDPLVAHKTFRLLYESRKWPQHMGLVSEFLFGMPELVTRSSSPPRAAA
jgi:integrase